MNDPSRRLLMIARHFPPLNVSGAARLESFARHLPNAGWATTVVSARDDDMTEADTLESDLPPSCRVVRAFAADVKTVFSAFGGYPAVLAFPDRNALWIVDGVRQALRCCRRERFDALLSTSPVVSAHCIAFVTKRVVGLPWIIDLRDPWNDEAPFGRFLTKLDDRLEHFLLTRADAITVTTPGMVEEITRVHGIEIGRKTHLVGNGYEEDAVARALSGATAPDSFRIVHIGDTPPNRDAVTFLRALRICLDRRTVPADISVELIDGESELVRTAIGALGLGSLVHTTPRVAHPVALERIARAAVLLLMQPNPIHRLAIPAKSYEYLRSGRMILAVTDECSETARLLRGYGGVRIAPGDADAIAASLGAIHVLWKTAPGRVFERDVSVYTRRRQAEALGRLLDTFASSAPEPRP